MYNDRLGAIFIVTSFMLVWYSLLMKVILPVIQLSELALCRKSVGLVGIAICIKACSQPLSPLKHGSHFNLGLF